jgi:hypothetical protein
VQASRLPHQRTQPGRLAPQRTAVCRIDTPLEIEYIRNGTYIPVAILTAYPEDPRLNEAAELGITRVFAKAKFNLADLLACVNEHTGPAAARGRGAAGR